MKDSTTMILGWIPNVDSTNLKVLEVGFQSNYPKALMKKYIERGEYRSDCPFGMYHINGTYYMLSWNEPSILTIANNPVISMRSSHLQASEFNSFGILGVTALFKTLESHGYQRPLEDSALLGRSKGYAVLKCSPLEEDKVQVFDSEITLGVYRAESFEIVERESKPDILLYDPRHVIHDPNSDVSSKALIPREFLKRDALQRTVDSVSSRFREVCAIIKASNRNRWISFAELPAQDTMILKRPKLSLPSGRTLDLAVRTDQTLGEMLISELSSPSDQFSVGMALDSVSPSKAKTKSVADFHRRFSQWLGQVIPLQHIDEPDNFAFDSDTAVVVLDDTVSGHSGLHDKIKEISEKPTKMVRLSTIMGKCGISLIVNLWLTLRARLTNCLFQISNTSQDVPLVAISHSIFLRGEYDVIASVSVANGVIKGTKWILHRETEFKGKELAVLRRMVTSLMSKSRLDDCVVIYSDEIALNTAIMELSAELGTGVVHVVKSNSVMLHSKGGVTSLPLDGLYYQLSETQFLLMTNGVPDVADYGIPRPVLVEIQAKDEYKPETIVSAIYDHTFLHPYALNKTKIPLPLYLSELLSYAPPSRDEWTSRVSEEVRI